MDLRDMYCRFVEIIDEAVVEKNIYAVPQAAAEVGMQGGGEQRNSGQRWNYALKGQDGLTLSVHARWWDQSQAFSIRPDMHVMTVELTGDVIPRHHEGRYEE